MKSKGLKEREEEQKREKIGIWILTIASFILIIRMFYGWFHGEVHGYDWYYGKGFDDLLNELRNKL